MFLASINALSRERGAWIYGDGGCVLLAFLSLKFLLLLFVPGSGGGFSPADESLLCGVCVEARGFDRLAEWEAQYAWDD